MQSDEETQTNSTRDWLRFPHFRHKHAVPAWLRLSRIPSKRADRYQQLRRRVVPGRLRVVVLKQATNWMLELIPRPNDHQSSFRQVLRFGVPLLVLLRFWGYLLLPRRGFPSPG